jgi:hypothetical protein
MGIKFVRIFFWQLIAISFLNSYVVAFKAETPKSSEDKNKYGFGSLWPNKDNFFKSQNNSNTDNNTDNVALKASQPITNPAISKKDKTWTAALKVLKSFSFTYVNKDSGLIKTDKAYISEFDNTNSCQYAVIINISDEGNLTVRIKSADDSAVRITKHEKFLKNKIVSAITTERSEIN